MLQYLQTDVGIKQKHLLQRVGVLYLNIKSYIVFAQNVGVFFVSRRYLGLSSC